MRMQIILHDEAPRIGSGLRLVDVVIGRKWVRLTSPAGTAKLTKAAWAPIARAGKELPPRRQRRKQISHG